MFQEKMAQFNSFGKKIASQKVEFKRQEIYARSEEIKKRQDEADRRHCEAALALEVATQLGQAYAQVAATPPAQEAPNENVRPRSPPRRTDSQGPDRSRSNKTVRTAICDSFKTASP